MCGLVGPYLLGTIREAQNHYYLCEFVSSASVCTDCAYADAGASVCTSSTSTARTWQALWTVPVTNANAARMPQIPIGAVLHQIGRTPEQSAMEFEETQLADGHKGLSSVQDTVVCDDRHTGFVTSQSNRSTTASSSSLAM